MLAQASRTAAPKAEKAEAKKPPERMEEASVPNPRWAALAFGSATGRGAVPPPPPPSARGSGAGLAPPGGGGEIRRSIADSRRETTGRDAPWTAPPPARVPDPLEVEAERMAESVTPPDRAGHSPATDTGPGRSGLAHPLRAALEPRLGVDLGAARLHTGGHAASLADALNAEAFTRGQDIYFGRGRYRPGTRSGDRLIAHEATHVAQQATGRVARGTVQRQIRPESGSASAPTAGRGPTFEQFSATHRADADLIDRLDRAVDSLVGQFERFYGTHPFDTFTRERYQRALRAAEAAKQAMLRDGFTPERIHHWLGAIGRLLHVMTEIRRGTPGVSGTTGYLAEPLDAARRSTGEVLQRARSLPLVAAVAREAAAREEAAAEAERERRSRAEAERRPTEADLPAAHEAVRNYFRTFRREIAAAPSLHAHVVARILAGYLEREQELYVRFFREATARGDAWRLALRMDGHLIRVLGRHYGIHGLERYDHHELGWGEVVLLALGGEFYRGQVNLEGERESPELSVVVVDTVITLIPLLDQAGDVRDVVAHIYYIAAEEEEREDPMRWLGVALTLIGLIPEVGTFVRGIVRSAISVARRYGYRALGAIYNLVQRNFPRATELAAETLASVAERWQRWAAAAPPLFVRIHERWKRGLMAVTGLSEAALDLVRRIAPRWLRDGLSRAHDLITDLLRRFTGGVAATARAIREELAAIRREVQGWTATGRLRRELEREQAAYDALVGRLDEAQAAAARALESGDLAAAQRHLDEAAELVDEGRRRYGGAPRPTRTAPESTTAAPRAAAPDAPTAEAPPAPRAAPTLDPHERRRGIDMEGHRATPDGEHEIEVYAGGRIGRCSPADTGQACPALTLVFAETLAARPGLRQELLALQRRVADAGDPTPAALLDELTRMEMRLRRLQHLDRVSPIPPGRTIRNVDPRRTMETVPPPPEMLELPDGTRVWRDEPGGPIRHEAVLGAPVGRSDYEAEHYTWNEASFTGPAQERAHSLGQGTGSESPFGIYFAPRFVNQQLQNHGIERYMRDLSRHAPAGVNFRVVTSSRGHWGTRRLATIEYRVYADRGGVGHHFFTFSISVGGTRQQPHVSWTGIQFAGNPLAQQLRGLVNVPARIRAAGSRP